MKWQQKSNSNFKNSLWCFENAVLAIELNLPSTIDTGESSVWWKWPGYRLPGTSGVYRRYCYNACMWGGWKINRQMVSGASSLLFCPERRIDMKEVQSRVGRSRQVTGVQRTLQRIISGYDPRISNWLCMYRTSIDWWNFIVLRYML